MSYRWLLLLAIPFLATLCTALGAVWIKVCMEKIGGFWGFPLWVGGVMTLMIVFIALPVVFFLSRVISQ